MTPEPTGDWQTWAAIAIVVGTAALFFRRAAKRKQQGGSCDSCGPGGCGPEQKE